MKDLKDYRCPRCERLLFKAEGSGLVQVQCDHCRKVRTMPLATKAVKVQTTR